MERTWEQICDFSKKTCQVSITLLEVIVGTRRQNKLDLWTPLDNLIKVVVSNLHCNKYLVIV